MFRRTTKSTNHKKSEEDARMTENLTVQTITPDDARELLKRNVHNRNLRERHVANMADDMRSGRWLDNHQSMTLQFAPDGVLLDGQHRLAAIVRSGLPRDMIIVRDVNPEVQEVLDVGRTRSLADMIKLRGGKYASDMATVIPYVWGFFNDANFAAASASWRPSTRALMEAYELHHTELEDSCRASKRLWDATRCGPISIGAFNHWRFGRIDVDDRDDFFTRLRLLDFRDDRDPLRAFYVALMKDQNTKKSNLTSQHKHALWVKTWNAYREGRPVHVIYWRRGGSNPESFPEPV